MTEESEQSIIEQIQSGQTEAFAVLYERYAERIYAFIYYKTQHRETAQDLTAQTFLKALDNIRSLKAREGSFQPWLYTIARNTVIDYYRTRHQSANIEDIWDLADNQDIERDTAIKDELKRVQAYIQQLSPVQRDVIILRVWQSMPYEDIAKIIGKSPDNCKMIFSRAIRKLRSELAMLLALSFIRLYM